jgi:hypothetical protein
LYRDQVSGTFPVVTAARKYVEEVVGRLTIPMNWLVDRSGLVHQKSSGFESRTPDWPQQMLEKLAAIAQ